jgi:hypothetical protein
MEGPEDEGGFKISDKRRFTLEGEPKTEAEATVEHTAKTEAPQAAPEPETKEMPEEESQQKPLPPVDFTMLILSLANTALFQMGFVNAPDSGITKDLEGARQSIDIIAMLEKKTEGNLTDEERKVLTEALFQLRMAFVEASK